MTQVIPIQVKETCCEMKKAGRNSREIYDEYFRLQFNKPQCYESFKTSLKRWSKTVYPDEATLESGTYQGFTAHGATVQVSGNGEIVQAWIKQTATDFDVEDFLNAIQNGVEPYQFKPQPHDDSNDMLEIPLFDMHWGVAFMEYYKPMLDEILELICRQHWKRIVIPFGQDFFHNDSIINPQTTRGTVIEKVDMVRAVKEGQQFTYAIIDSAINQADEVRVVYTPGNHDKSISWMFMQTLLERYGSEIVDDSLDYTKVITYGKNSVMITHGDAKRFTPHNLAHMFPVSFPEEFANSNIREVHAGHLHCEADTDVFGIMIRRLSSGNRTDDWSKNEGFIGAHKRFMLFEWNPEKLKAIHYI